MLVSPPGQFHFHALRARTLRAIGSTRQARESKHHDQRNNNTFRFRMFSSFLASRPRPSTVLEFFRIALGTTNIAP